MNSQQSKHRPQVAGDRGRILALALAAALLALTIWAAAALAAGPPLVSGTAVSRIGVTSAKLEAKLNPNGREVKEYFFEYVDQTGFDAHGFEGAAQTPAATLPSGTSDIPLATQISGLAPETTYHFLLFAQNTLGKTEGPPLSFTTFPAPQIFEPCANDAFRGVSPSGALPDCRAYEQASPVDKNGGDLSASILHTKGSVNGDRITFAAVAPIPGGEGSQVFSPPYMASRGAVGWSTQGILPPQSLGQEANFTSQTADLSQIFGYVVKIGEPRKTGIYMRSSADGSLTMIVPQTAGVIRPRVSGSSPDGSIVFFEFIGAPLTPEAAPQKSNLYVWDRESDTVRLAGIFNDGEAPANGSFAGPYNWERNKTNEGGAENFFYTRDLHTNSTDGSKAYFTAGKSGQLYLRLNPSKPQSPISAGHCTDPALACTIQVSASHKKDGTGPGGTDAAGPQPAAFRGASADGSVAFFTSSEMLTDDANTGVEQLPAQIGRAKIGAAEGEAPEPGFLPKHAVGVAVSPDGEYLYWADPVDGTIGRAKLNGSEPASEKKDDFIVPGPTEFETHPKTEPGVLHQAPSRPRYVAVDSEYVYWTNTGPVVDYGVGEGPVKDAGTIGRAKLGPTGPEGIEPEFITGASNPQGIAVNPERIYWANGEASAQVVIITSPDNYISRATLDGNTVDRKFFRPHFGGPVGLALDETHLYFDVYDPLNNLGYVERIALDGSGTDEGGFIGKTRLAGIVHAGSYVYWAAAGEGAIGRRPIASLESSCVSDPNCQPEYLKAAGNLGGLAGDDERLYWASNGESSTNPGNDLYRFEAANQSEPLTDLTPDPAETNGAEVQGVLGSSEDGSYVYFVANGVFGAAPEAGTCRRINSNHPSGKCNLYLAHAGQVSFIARLDGDNDFTDWTGSAVAGGEGLEPKTSLVSADGRTLLFRSSEKLGAYQNASISEYYRYRSGEAGTPRCITCNPTGLAPSARPTLGSIISAGPQPNYPAPVLSRNMSADGNRIFFETPEALVAADTNGNEACPTSPGTEGVHTCQDVYEWEAQGSGSCASSAQNGGCLYLISSGKSSDASYFADASGSGGDVFFYTRSQLVGQDQDSYRDVYDARVLGGLAAQNQPPLPPPCEAEACRAGATPPPPSGSPGTGSFAGPPDPKPVHKHKKGKRKKHHHKHRRHATKHGRTHR